ncbi:RIP metalloprotease RseP [Desulfurobacterium indicum]|uniref:Zinc metalloprotease n=1 Tax=Desulfurobacterium indicum TaxID=1914305 RepID=A0A1R1MKU6_9BACT|nr:RIP metalloprotease RseP [Desulfurobacterium indicum]OMH40324.1 RIP metalloprotease RseP [Desulfurobacterium indicum]
MITLLAFIVALGILITIHEAGHFAAAKFFDVEVETFSIGFGPPILKKKIGETEYVIAVIPLGGYVKMAGENPDEPVKSERDFYAKPPWQRIIIALAGPLMNLILAVFLFSTVYTIGRYIPTYRIEAPKVGFAPLNSTLRQGDIIEKVNGKKVETWEDFEKIVTLNPDKTLKLFIKRNGKEITVNVKTERDNETGTGFINVIPAIKPIVGQVAKNSPAEKAGLKKGDIILKIDEKEIKSWEDVVNIIKSSNGKVLTITVLRNGKRINLKVKPKYSKEYKKYIIGIIPKIDQTFVRYPFPESVKMGFKEFISQSALFFTFLKKLLTGGASVKSLGGPIMIAQVAGRAAKAGLSSFLYFMAFISLQLGYFNLIPLPVLDGGLILMFLIEWIRGKPLSVEFRERFQQIGFAILGFLMVLVFYNDIMRLFH